MWRRLRGPLVLTGAAIVLAVAAGAAVRPNFVDTQNFCAMMPDSIGLYPGNFVTQMGVRVGTVEHVEPAGTAVRVEFSVDAARPLPAQVRAVSRASSILADRNLELVGNYTAGPRLSPGQCIDISATATAKSISEITGATAGLLDGLGGAGNGNALGSALAELGAQLSGNGAAAGAALTDAGQAAAGSDAMISTLGQLLANAAPLVTAADQHWSEIDSALASAPAALNELAHQVFPAITQIFYYLPNAMNLILDVQQRLGHILWPGLDVVATTLRVAATRAADIERLVATLPVLSDSVRGLLADPGGPEIALIPPRFRVTVADPQALCAFLGAGCTVTADQAQLADVDLLQLVLRGGVPR